MLVKLTKNEVSRCEKFAEAQLKTSKRLYSYRGESRKDKILEDIKLGKMGELGVYKFLKKMGIEVSKVDFKIYTGSRKSFDCDISSPNLKIHIKSQGVTSASRYGNSWLMQKTDPLISDPGKQDIFIFTLVKEPNEIEIIGGISCLALNKNDLYGVPKVPSYRHSKVALYWDDLEETKYAVKELSRWKLLCKEVHLE